MGDKEHKTEALAPTIKNKNIKSKESCLAYSTVNGGSRKIERTYVDYRGKSTQIWTEVSQNKRLIKN